MAVTDTQARTDAKQGFCSDCRRGDHASCASPRCTCPDARRHRNRPGYGGYGSAESPPPRAAARTSTPTPRRNETRPPDDALPFEPVASDKRAGPVWGLVQAEPPKPPAKKSHVDEARTLLEQIMAKGSGEWFRLGVFPSPRTAAHMAGRLRKRHSSSEWQFEAVSVPEVGQSALYARWLAAPKASEADPA